MSKKVYYRYNPSTESYERVFPSRRKRIFSVIRHSVEALAVSAAIFAALYIFVDLPKEKVLISRNEELKRQLVETDRRLNTAIEVMDELAERDNNFYRVIMQLDPLTSSRRYAGLPAIPSSTDADGLNDAELVNSVTAKLGLFERQVYVQSLSFDQLTDAVANNADRISHIPSIQPVSEKRMTSMASGYGYRIDPVYGTTKHHDGMDFASPTGTPVYATGDAIVRDTGWNSGYGKTIELDHGYNYMTRYAHLSEILVHPGQSVKRGDLIGRVGSTGKSTGSHLHYEVHYKGIPQNPVNYYFRDLTPEQYDQMVRDSENAGHVMD